MNSEPPPDVAAAAARVQAWIDGEDAAARDAANRGPSAADRLTEMRERQFAAGQQNKPLPTPVAPQVPTPAANVAAMSQAERWELMRRTDQSTMRPWQPPS
jgi:hypothetical protein